MSETFIQRTQRIQAERLKALEEGTLKLVPTTPVAPPVPAIPKTVGPSSCPSPELLKRLRDDLSKCRNGSQFTKAAIQLATVLHPLAKHFEEVLKTEADFHRRKMMEHWVDCLSNGFFPYCNDIWSKGPSDSRNPFIAWMLTTCPYITDDNTIPNWPANI